MKFSIVSICLKLAELAGSKLNLLKKYVKMGALPAPPTQEEAKERPLGCRIIFRILAILVNEVSKSVCR